MYYLPRPDPRKLIYISNIYWYIYTYFHQFIPISNYFHVYLTYLCIFLTSFHVYLYLHLTYLDIFSCIFIPIFMYISTYFYIFILISTYLLLFSTCRALHLLLPARVLSASRHKSVLFYYRLPQKCVVLLQIATKVWYFTTVYRYLPHKCGILLQFDTKVWARNVPQNEAQTNYVPHVPQMRHS